MALATTLQRFILPPIHGLTKLTFRLLKGSVYYVCHWVNVSRRSALPPVADLNPSTAELPSITLTPIEQETIAVAEQASLIMTPAFVEPPAATEEAPTDLQQIFDTAIPEEKPQPDRITLVQALLDEAWSMGLTTYPKLIAYVKRHTGKGCSKRAIAQWKKSRSLMDV